MGYKKAAGKKALPRSLFPAARRRTISHLLYKYNEGIKVAEENDKLVALDITIDDKLYEEFMYRKLLRDKN